MSPPPAGITVVVGEDTNNGFAVPKATGLVSSHHQHDCRWPGVLTTSKESSWLLVGTSTTASPSRRPLAWCHHTTSMTAAGLVSSPPAGITVVVGEDTNNGLS